MNSYTYHNKKLSNKRKKLRLTISDAAKSLTLSTTQIKSLENNLDIGFASPKYKFILLKRYAKLLNIEIDSLIVIEDKLDQEKENKSAPQKSHIVPHNKANYFVLAIVLIGFVFYLFNSDLSRSENPMSAENEVTPEPEIISLEKKQIEVADTFSENLESAAPISDSNNEDNELDSQFNEVVDDQTMALVDEVFTKTQLDNISEGTASTSNDDFLCTVETSQLKSFSTQNPEKSSYYFYFISYDTQKICVVDSLGALKEYNLKKGAKFSHYGSPPFKIQLNPNVSEIYFEGWKVNLQDNDYFIQLDPTLSP